MASVDTSDSDISRSSSTVEATQTANATTRNQIGGALNDDPKTFINIQKLISRDGIFRAVQMALCLLAFIFVQTARWCRHEGQHTYICDSDLVPVYRFFPAVTVTSFAVTFLMCSLDVTNVLDKFNEAIRGWPIVIVVVLAQSGICAIFLFFASAVLAGEGYTSNGLIVASVFGFLAFVVFALHFGLIFTRQYKQTPAVTTTQTRNSVDIFGGGTAVIPMDSHNNMTDPVEAQIQQPTCSILLMRPRRSPSASPQNQHRDQEPYGQFHNDRQKTNDNLDSSRSTSPVSPGKLRLVCHDSSVYNCSYSDTSEERLSSWDPNEQRLYDNLSTNTFTVEAACV